MNLRVTPALLSSTVLVAAASLMTAGCSIKQAAPVKKTFLIEAQRTAPPRSSPTPMSLRVRSIQVSEPFEGCEFVYRRSELNFESDFYNEFLVPPRALVTSQLRRWFESSGLFRAVLDPASKADATHYLEGNVTALYGDYRETAAPKAVFAIQFVLLNEQSTTSQIVFQRGYSQEVPLEGRGSESLAKAWSKALAQILTSLEGDLPVAIPEFKK
jgi:cholesterol transport system auxiliary component